MRILVDDLRQHVRSTNSAMSAQMSGASTAEDSSRAPARLAACALLLHVQLPHPLAHLNALGLSTPSSPASRLEPFTLLAGNTRRLRDELAHNSSLLSKLVPLLVSP